jgi:hypothetical protein
LRIVVRFSRKNKATVCYGDLFTCKSTPAGKPHLQFSASHSTHDDQNLTKLQRTGINATPLDWLSDVIVAHCQMVVERYEELISKADEGIVLDGVRRAFNLVKAQACMLGTMRLLSRRRCSLMKVSESLL